MAPQHSPGASCLQPGTVDHDLQFEDRALVSALAYWHSRCRGSRAPRRRDLDPTEMRSFVTKVALVDIARDDKGAQTYRVRLAGTNLENVYGAVTGKSLSQFLSPTVEERWCELFDATLRANGPLRYFGQLAFGDRSWMRCEVLLAPLVDENDATSMLFVTVAVTRVT